MVKLCVFFYLCQPFWPSIMMKKWLNIKPKVYDFSEDEVDTESEDDGMACFIHVSCFITLCALLLVYDVTVVLGSLLL